MHGERKWLIHCIINSFTNIYVVYEATVWDAGFIGINETELLSQEAHTVFSRER